MAPMIRPLRTKGVPVDYVRPEDIFSDRRDPHASPLSSSPRRMYPRAPGASTLGQTVEAVYRGQPTHRAGDE
jgi:hypothetical protein